MSSYFFIVFIFFFHCCLFFFFFNDTATTEIYTLSLHDALPICSRRHGLHPGAGRAVAPGCQRADRKSTRLNSSHRCSSYAVFCLKKKKNLQSNLLPLTILERVQLPQALFLLFLARRNVRHLVCFGRCIFFFNDTATTEIYTLSLHDALPI